MTRIEAKPALAAGKGERTAPGSAIAPATTGAP